MKEGTHFTASAYIVFEDKVLLHKHPKIGLYIQPGGYLDENELPTDAVIREIKEETGLDIALIDTRDDSHDDGVWHEMNMGMVTARIESRPGVTMLDTIYAATVDSLDMLGTGEHNKDRFNLMTLDEIQNHPEIMPNVKHYAREALRLVQNKRDSM